MNNNDVITKFMLIMDKILTLDSRENYSYNFFIEYLDLISSKIDNQLTKNNFNNCIKIFKDNYCDFKYINGIMFKYYDIYKNDNIFSNYLPCFINEDFKKAILDY